MLLLCECVCRIWFIKRFHLAVLGILLHLRSMRSDVLLSLLDALMQMSASVFNILVGVLTCVITASVLLCDIVASTFKPRQSVVRYFNALADALIKMLEQAPPPAMDTSNIAIASGLSPNICRSEPRFATMQTALASLASNFLARRS